MRTMQKPHVRYKLCWRNLRRIVRNDFSRDLLAVCDGDMPLLPGTFRYTTTGAITFSIADGSAALEISYSWEPCAA